VSFLGSCLWAQSGGAPFRPWRWPGSQRVSLAVTEPYYLPLTLLHGTGFTRLHKGQCWSVLKSLPSLTLPLLDSCCPDCHLHIHPDLCLAFSKTSLGCLTALKELLGPWESKVHFSGSVTPLG
jgi:hypothetical protein